MKLWSGRTYKNFLKSNSWIDKRLIGMLDLMYMSDPKKELIKFGRKIYAEQFVIGTGGNISVRHGSKVYIKASGVSLEDSGAADYNEVDLKTGKTTCFKGPCSIEIPMHMACYKARPDIGAVIHTHPIYGTVAGIVGKKLKTISYEFKYTMKSEVPVIGYKEPGSIALGKAVERSIKKHNGLLLKNHGIITVGKTIEEAYLRALALERACKVYILSKLSGRISFISK